MNNILIKQQEKYDKIARLEGLIKSNSDPRELKRALAVKMSIEGYSDRMIAQLLGVSTSFVRDWKRAFKVGGIAGIKLGYQGAIGKLTTEQRAEIIEWLKNKDYWHLDESKRSPTKSGRRYLATSEELLEEILVFVQVILGCQKAV